jgi:hypothetical protein
MWGGNYSRVTTTVKGLAVTPRPADVQHLDPADASSCARRRGRVRDPAIGRALSPARNGGAHGTRRSESPGASSNLTAPRMRTQTQLSCAAPGADSQVEAKPPPDIGNGTPQESLCPPQTTAATTAIPLIRAGAQCTKGNLRIRACGLLEDEPVDSGWTGGVVFHSGASGRVVRRASGRVATADRASRGVAPRASCRAAACSRAGAPGCRRGAWRVGTVPAHAHGVA